MSVPHSRRSEPSTPADWRWVPLKELVYRPQYGTSESTSDNTGIPVVGMGAIQNGRVCLRDLPRATLSMDETYALALKRNDLLFNRTNSLAHVGKAGLVLDEPEEITAFASYLVRLEIIGEATDARFLKETLCSHPAVARMKSLATPGVSQYNINPTSLLNDFWLLAPPKEVQIAIAVASCHFDSTAIAVENELKQREVRKVGLMRELLSGRRRFPEFTKPWVDRRIGELLERCSVEWEEVSDFRSYKLLSLRRRSGGPFHRETKSGSQIKGDLLRPLSVNEFLVSKMQVVRGAWKLIPPDFEGFYVSQSYRSFQSRSPDRLLIEYFDRLSETSSLYYKVFRSCVGVHIEKMTFLEKFFLRERIRLPKETGEQEKIIGLIDLLEKEISLLKRMRTAIEKQKRGVMERLLSGEVIIPDNVVERLNLEAEKEERQRPKDAKRAKAAIENAS